MTVFGGRKIHQWARHALVAAAIGLSGLPASAQQQPANVDVQKIEAVVNDQVISAYDVEQRLNLILASVNAQISPEQRRVLRQQALENLVDEKLQLQEAKTFDLVISDQELDETIARIAEQYQMSTEQFGVYLAQQGASLDALRAQVEAELAWTRLVRGRFSQQISVGDDEVQAVLDRLKESTGQNEYLVSEIFLMVDNPASEREARTRAQRIVDQLRQGVPFNVMARQFSEASTAAVGGDLGWVPQGQLAEDVDAALAEMRVNEISDPIRTPGGFVIMQLRDRRKILTADASDAHVTLHQLLFPVKEGENADAVKTRIAEKTASLSGCDAIPEQPAELGATDSSRLPAIRIGDLPAPIQEVVEDLPIGEASEPVPAPSGFRVLMVCDKTEPEVNMPTFDTISNSLTQQRLSLMARRYLRDLRRDAIVDYR